MVFIQLATLTSKSSLTGKIKASSLPASLPSLFSLVNLSHAGLLLVTSYPYSCIKNMAWKRLIFHTEIWNIP